MLTTVIIILACLCLLTMTGFLSGLWWIFDITAHFRVQYGLLLLVLALGFFVMVQPIYGGVAALFAAVNLMMVLPVYFRRDRHTNDSSRQSTLRILSANVEKSNNQPGLVAELVGDVNPDIVVLAEVGEEWVMKIGELLPEHHYVVFGSGGSRGFGIALFSRLPLEHSETIDTGQIGAPVAVAGCRVSGQYLRVIGVHPVPPFNARWCAARNRYLEELIAVVRRANGEAIVIGDMNTTPWTPAFRALRNGAALRDSRQGFGIQSSWPSRMLPLRIPIDHCLVTSELRVVHRRVERDIGSDHRPIVVDIVVK